MSEGYRGEEIEDREAIDRRIKEMISNSANYILLTFEDVGDGKPPLIKTASSLPTPLLPRALDYAMAVITRNIQEVS